MAHEIFYMRLLFIFRGFIAAAMLYFAGISGAHAEILNILCGNELFKVDTVSNTLLAQGSTDRISWNFDGEWIRLTAADDTDLIAFSSKSGYIIQNGKQFNADCRFTNPELLAKLKVEPTSNLRLEFISLNISERKRVQELMSKYGYYNSDIDGLWGRQTLDALIRFKQYVNSIVGQDYQIETSAGASQYLLGILQIPNEAKKGEGKVATGPSFDCRRATTPDENTICASSKLAELDNAVSDAFEQVKKVRGENTARIVGRLHLDNRRQCEADATCIEKVQRDAINSFVVLGAQVTPPPTDKGNPSAVTADQPVVTVKAERQQEEVNTIAQEPPRLNPKPDPNTFLKGKNSSELIVLFVLVGLVLVFILAITGRLVIYNDGFDLALNLGISLIPITAFAFITLSAPSEEQGQVAKEFYYNQSWVIFARFGSIVAGICCALSTAWISIRENGFFWGALVALVKISLSIFAIALSIFWLFTYLLFGDDSYKNQYERDRDRRKTKVIFLAIIAGLTYALVNGERVRNRRERKSLAQQNLGSNFENSTPRRLSPSSSSLVFDISLLNAETGHTYQTQLSFDKVPINIISKFTPNKSENEWVAIFENLFAPSKDENHSIGIFYEEARSKLTRVAFEKLGWHDVMVIFTGATVRGTKLRLSQEDEDAWSDFIRLQLDRSDRSFYFY